MDLLRFGPPTRSTSRDGSRLPLLLALVLASPAPVRAESPKSEPKPRVTWLTYEQVPYFVTEASEGGRGVGTGLLDRFIAALPGYEHVVMRVNIPRYDREVGNPNTCVPVAWTSENEAALLHSRAHSVEPPMGIIVRADQVDRFGEPGTILSLESLLAKPGLTLGALVKMGYGDRVMRLLEQYREDGRVRFFTPDDAEIGLHLIGRRVDFILGIRGQVVAHNMASGSADYLFYGIEEIDDYVELFAHCSDDVVGRQVMERIQDLLKPQLLQELLSEYEGWYGPSPLFREVFTQHVIEGKPHDAVKSGF